MGLAIFVQAKEIGVSFVLSRARTDAAARRNGAREFPPRDSVSHFHKTARCSAKKTLDLLDSHRNLIPIISVEGSQEQTDARRGAGTYQKLLETMTAFKAPACFFGASVTVTSEKPRVRHERRF
jgi:hypothetical protein